MGKEHHSKHHRKATEVLRGKGKTLNDVKIGPRAMVKFHEDRGIPADKDGNIPDKESQLRTRLGESTEINPKSITLVGGRSPIMRGHYFLDPQDQSVYFIKVGKKGDVSVGDIFFPGKGRGEMQYSY